MRIVKSFSLFSIFAAFVVILAGPMTVRAADTVSIAVVDVQSLLAESIAGKNIQQQIETRKTKFLSELSEQEKKLREDEKTLTGERATLAAEEFAKKAKAFEENLTETRRSAQERKKALEEAAAKALTKLRDEILKVVQGISDEKGYTLVLNRQNVVINNKTLDITDEARGKLDKAITEIALDVSDK